MHTNNPKFYKKYKLYSTDRKGKRCEYYLRKHAGLKFSGLGYSCTTDDNGLTTYFTFGEKCTLIYQTSEYCRKKCECVWSFP